MCRWESVKERERKSVRERELCNPKPRSVEIVPLLSFIAFRCQVVTMNIKATLRTHLHAFMSLFPTCLSLNIFFFLWTNEEKQRFFRDCGSIHASQRVFCNALYWAAAVETSPCVVLLFSERCAMYFSRCARENLIPFRSEVIFIQLGLNSLEKTKQQRQADRDLRADGVLKVIAWLELNVPPAAAGDINTRNTSLSRSAGACRSAVTSGSWAMTHTAAVAGLTSVTLHSPWVRAHDTNCGGWDQRKHWATVTNWEKRVNKHLVMKCCWDSSWLRGFRKMSSCPVWMCRYQTFSISLHSG